MVAPRVGAAVADEVEADLALGALDAAVGLAGLRPEAAELGLRVHDRSGRQAGERLPQDREGLPHLEDADHVAVIDVAMRPKRDAELETRVHPVAVHLAEVVVDAGGAEHRAGDAGVDRQRGTETAHALGAREEDLVAREQGLELVEEGPVAADELLRAGQPVGRGIHAAAAEALVVAHHAGPAERLEEVEDLLALTERVHQRRAAAAAVLHQEPGEAGVVQQAREFGKDDPHVLRALWHRDPGQLLDGAGVGPVVRHRVQVIEPVGVRHRAQVAGVFRQFFVVAVQVAEHGLEPHDRLAVERDDHPEHAVRGGMVRPHGNLQQVAGQFAADGPDVGAGRRGGKGGGGVHGAEGAGAG